MNNLNNKKAMLLAVGTIVVILMFGLGASIVKSAGKGALNEHIISQVIPEERLEMLQELIAEKNGENIVSKTFSQINEEIEKASGSVLRDGGSQATDH